MRPLREKIIQQRKKKKDRLNRTSYTKKNRNNNSVLPKINDDSKMIESENLDHSNIDHAGSEEKDYGSNKKGRSNNLYSISKRKRTNKSTRYGHQRLRSHQNRTKVRIQGKNGVHSEKYVDIEKSLHQQNEQRERKRYILKARQRHKIQEKIEKYREEKIQREIELLDEAKRLEEEEKQREHKREERRYAYEFRLRFIFHIEKGILRSKERN